MPHKTESKVIFQAQDSPVVCFVSRDTTEDKSDGDGGGAADKRKGRGKDREMIGHSLIQTASSTYDLPPLSTITLEEVKVAGTWSAYGMHVQQPLLVCGVSYGISSHVIRKLRWESPTGEQDAAAVKIQKVHRGKAARTRMNKHSGASGGDFMSNFHRSQRRVKEESAATTIQKHARGRAARGKVKVPGGRGLRRQLQEVKEEEEDDLMWA